MSPPTSLSRSVVLLVVLGVGAVGLLLVGTGTVTTAEPTEEAVREPVPEPGDPYYEAAAPDGSWISYINPRDEYRSPYLGNGSGKLCVTLLNEAGEPIVGETVPNTSVTIETGDTLAWHSGADPFTVEFPLTEGSERPLDSDQFGTDPALPQGDGYLDAHCIEFHGLPEDAPVTYGQPSLSGTHADRLEVVGVHEQAGREWNASVDPVADAVPLEAAGGWVNAPDGSHGQAVVVLQLTGDAAPDGASSGASLPVGRAAVAVGLLAGALALVGGLLARWR